MSSSFSTPVNISNTPQPSTDPQIAVDGRNVYVVWVEVSPTFNTDFNIFFSRSIDNGASFSVPVNLSNGRLGRIYPQIAISGNNVYVIWTGDPAPGGGSGEVYFTRSTDNGITFSVPISLSNNNGDSQYPQIVASGNYVYVVWNYNDTEILLARSTDNGASFGTLVTVLGFNADYYSNLKISISGYNVYVVWGGNDRKIWFTKSGDNGASFTTPKSISNNSSGSWYPEIASFGYNVYVVWFDITSANSQVSFVRSVDGGITFSVPINMSQNSYGAENPHIVSSSNCVYIIWVAGDPSVPGRQIFFINSIDGGNTFSPLLDISKGSGPISDGFLSVTGNDVFVGWSQKMDNNNGVPNTDIFFTCSNDNGINFSRPVNLSNSPTNSSQGLYIASSANTVYVIWEEGDVTSDADILFSRGSCVGKKIKLPHIKKIIDGPNKVHPGEPVEHLQKSMEEKLVRQ